MNIEQSRIPGKEKVMEKQMLEGKVAIITGASYGMGETMVELFAEEGAAVVLCAISRRR